MSSLFHIHSILIMCGFFMDKEAMLEIASTNNFTIILWHLKKK